MEALGHRSSGRKTLREIVKILQEMDRDDCVDIVRDVILKEVRKVGVINAELLDESGIEDILSWNADCLPRCESLILMPGLRGFDALHGFSEILQQLPDFVKYLVLAVIVVFILKGMT
ncbi:uncharacterized protein [Ptychodera flava]|uniref:uncharacterized protein n=1 Tax=Ptychodera flava TaxID=63121 RepID=UPI003969D2C6